MGLRDASAPVPPRSPLIPVIVDSVKRYPSFDMSRCNYLCIDLDTPRPGWSIQIGSIVVPFLMLRLGGIVYEPIGGGLFDSPQKIMDLFVHLEEEATLLIEMDDVWLPNFVLRNGDASVGDVFRVPNRLYYFVRAASGCTTSLSVAGATWRTSGTVREKRLHF